MPSEINYSLLPEHIRGGVKRYIEQGIRPGDFLQAVISNKLKESFERADDINRYEMFKIVLFFYNEAPLSCWKSEDSMNRWIKDGGLEGITNEPSND